MAEDENSPSWKPADIPLNGTVQIKLLSSAEIATGKSKFGDWYLWVAEVKNQLVYEGRGKDVKPIQGYSGEAVFFPSQKMHERLLEITEEKFEEIDIKITKQVVENRRGKTYTQYKVEKLSEGKPSETVSNLNVIQDFKSLKESNAIESITLEMFKEAATIEPYNLSDKEAMLLYEQFKEELQ